MRWSKNFAAAGQVVAALPGRAALLALPVATSVALALATLAIDHGVAGKAHEAAVNRGMDLIVIRGGAGVVAGKSGAVSTLTIEETELLKSQLRGCKAIVPTRREDQVPTSFGGKNGVYKVFGVTHDWGVVRDFGAERGDFLSEAEVGGSGRVCVIGQTVARELFGSQDPVGQEISLNQVPFRVKGVLVARGASPAEGDRDARIVVPITTFYDRLYKRLHLDQIVIQVADPTRENITRLAEETRKILRQQDRKSTRLNSSHIQKSRMPSSA